MRKRNTKKNPKRRKNRCCHVANEFTNFTVKHAVSQGWRVHCTHAAAAVAVYITSAAVVVVTKFIILVHSTYVEICFLLF